MTESKQINKNEQEVKIVLPEVIVIILQISKVIFS